MIDRLRGATPGERQLHYELTLSERVFRGYGIDHEAKIEEAPTQREKAARNHKAQRNYARAASCRRALDLYESEPVARFPDEHRQIYWAARHYPKAWLLTLIMGGILGFGLGCAMVLIIISLK